MAANYRTFPQRIGFHWICVAPATCLSNTPLQGDQGESQPSLRSVCSDQGLCYLQVLRALTCGDLYLARVAAHPDQLDTSEAELIFLSEEQLRATLPWDIRLAGLAKKPESLCALLRTHAANLKPLVPSPPPAPAQPEPVVDEVEVEDLPVVHEVYITQQHMQQVINPPSGRRPRMSVALIQFVLANLKPEVCRFSKRAIALYRRILAILKWVKRFPRQRAMTVSRKWDIPLSNWIWCVTVRQPLALIS